MNAKILVFVICIEAIIYLLLYNLHDCTFNMCVYFFFIQKKEQTKSTSAIKKKFFSREIFDLKV